MQHEHVRTCQAQYALPHGAQRDCAAWLIIHSNWSRQIRFIRRFRYVANIRRSGITVQIRWIVPDESTTAWGCKPPCGVLTLVLDHLLQSSHLSFDPSKTRQLSAVIYRAMAGLFGFAHGATKHYIRPE
jgi:hypothetical protein